MVELDWCPCIDDQTRIDFAHASVRDIQTKYSIHEPLTLISLGSGALKQEELIARLLLDAGYTKLEVILIDPLYKQQVPVTLDELETQTTHFESSKDFITLGDLYIELEKTDDPAQIARIEKEIDTLEKKMHIEEYVALCDQQVTLLHGERLELLKQSLKIPIQDYSNVEDCPAIKTNCVLLYIDPDTREQYKVQQENDYKKLIAKIPQLLCIALAP